MPNFMFCHKTTTFCFFSSTSMQSFRIQPGCPVPIFPIFFYFLSLFLFSPIFLTKTSYFSYFLAGEAKICNKIKNYICMCFWVRFIIKLVVFWLWCSNISKSNGHIILFFPWPLLPIRVLLTTLLCCCFLYNLPVHLHVCRVIVLMTIT